MQLVTIDAIDPTSLRPVVGAQTYGRGVAYARAAGQAAAPDQAAGQAPDQGTGGRRTAGEARAVLLEVELLTRATAAFTSGTYNASAKKVLGLVHDVDRNRFTILQSLTLLRQLSLHPALVEPEHAHLGASKIDALVDQLRDVIDGGHGALVFSQFTGFLAHVRERLDSADVEYTYLDGQRGTGHWSSGGSRRAGKERTLSKFKVLEARRPMPHQTWEQVAYIAITHMHSQSRAGPAVFDRVQGVREQQATSNGTC